MSQRTGSGCRAAFVLSDTGGEEDGEGGRGVRDNRGCIAVCNCGDYDSFFEKTMR